MSKDKQTFEDAWLDGEAPAAPEHARKKKAADDERMAESAAFSASWNELKDE